MPLYDYRCPACGAQFEARHSFSAPAPACPQCGTPEPQRIITAVPSTLKGMAADAGSSGKASNEQMKSKWAEETPKLRDQLTKKLGEETVRRNAPSLFND
jgi:putative FmdB family regulatory protein